MIITLNRFETDLSKIQEIPTTFFAKIEASTEFGEHLFPDWGIDKKGVTNVFGSTSLFKKFRAIYDKYKAIKSEDERDKIVSAFRHNNNIENLCNNVAGTELIKLKDLDKSIRDEIDTLFLHLYNSVLKYHRFETYIGDTIKEAIDKFITNNKGITVCPFCGIESFYNLKGQARIPLDHWLCKDLFPMAAINFDNLVPIGTICNARPAKGSKNILIDDDHARITAFYPYTNHGKITRSFSYLKEPSIDGIKDTDWNFSISPKNSAEQSMFDSWNSIFNISIRYIDFFKKIIIPMWEEDYKRYIKGEDEDDDEDDIGHAENITELRAKFKLWRKSFPLRKKPGAILYRAFITYLINDASDAYLYGLCENFKRSQ